MIKFSKGSEWRQWDLHVHTPASILKNEFGDDWDEYVATLFRKAIEQNVSAIGITDYYLPEGYKILKKEYLENTGKLNEIFNPEEIEKISEIQVFPNIEFRITKLVLGKDKDLSWNRKVNFHVILSNDIPIEKIESDFISQIKIAVNAAAGSTTEKRPLTRANLESLGQRLIHEHPPFASSGSPLFVGMLNASVDEDEVISILKNNSDFRENFLIGLPCDEDLSDVNWNSQGHSIRKNLIKQAHFIFSSNKKTKNFLLGGNDRKAFEKEFGALKPCLWGSDAHNKNELFKPDDNRRTWIKADLTFEGLKQVVHEPASRVAIQDLNPQQKSKYQTINRARFIDKNENERFSNEWQYFNPDLNTIIGGKSSGKSLLLYHIAKAVNHNEVNEKISLSNASSYNELNLSDFEVEWSNGDISRLSEPTDSKPITYIPQLYINHLAEESGKHQLNDLVKNLLEQNSQFKDFAQEQERKIAYTNKEITSKIDALYELRGKYTSIIKEMDTFGTKNAISDEVTSLKEEIAKLREKSGFTLDEENNYKTLSIRKSCLESRLSTLKTIERCGLQVIESISNNSDYLKTNFKKQISSEIDIQNSSTYLLGLLSNLDKSLDQAVSRFKTEVSEKQAKIPVNASKINSEIKAVDNLLAPLLKKVTDKKSLEVSSTKLQQEEQKLKKIEELEVKLKSIKSEGFKCKTDISALYEKLVKLYLNYVSEVENPAYQVEKDIKICSEINFNEDKFNEFISSFDRRGNMTSLLGDLTTNSGELNYNIDDHAEKILAIHSKFDSKTDIPSIRRGIPDIDVIKRLYADCFYMNFIVQYKDDDIIRMSPGKRGLVLLNLILHLSNSTHPILIDQPEDNLDNRTIYDQLNEFVKQRKTKRQIIMVTHNANLVVSADSECVIVANQAGQQANIENDKFRFEYLSGSLECSYQPTDQSAKLKHKGIRQHVCEILEGGILAFKEREQKYGFRN